MDERPVPQGPLTFVFTDIEGHSALWDERPEAMALALREHDALVAARIRDAGGHVVKNAGDGVMAVFGDAGRAVDAAVAIQRELTTREWPDIGRLRVRMGMHVGPAEARDGDYFGSDVIRAARLCAAANGGQIVASSAVAELAPATGWLDLGPHHLRGFAAPTVVHQVVAEGLEARFPALRTLDAHRHTLPRFRTEFIGRETEIEPIAALLRRHRIVTLTGIGGSGKTRLAVEVAHDQLGSFADGAYFVDLSVVTENDRLWDAVAGALELEVSRGLRAAASPRDMVLRALGSRRALLILDNCEHLLDAAADVVDAALDATRELVILATSREGLHIEGERMVQVPSLPIATDALALFCDRATAAGVGELDEDAARAICERLDGLPLAIELAAARCAQLGVEEVARLLDDRFRLLTGSRRRVPRQRTLEATLDWSYDLLSRHEQGVLQRLSVFAGTFPLRATERVADATADIMGSLVDKSLVQRAADGRFRLLETVRAYGEQRLVEAGGAEPTREALAEWLVAETEALPDDEVMLRGPLAEALLLGELHNLYAALAWASGRRRWVVVARLASFAALGGGLKVGDLSLRPMLDHLIEALDSGVADRDRDRALAGFAALAHLAPDAEARLDVWQEAGERGMASDGGEGVVALSLVANALDAVSRAQGDDRGVRQAARLLTRAYALAEDLGPQWRILPAQIEVNLALGATDWSRAAACTLAVTALRAEHQIDSPSIFEVLTEAVALLAAGQGLDRDQLSRQVAAVTHTERVAGLAPQIEACAAPSPTRTRAPIEVDRRAFDRTTRLGATSFLICVAVLATRDGVWPVAARLLAAARAGGGIFSTPAGVSLYRLTVPTVHASLDKATRDMLRAEGTEMGLERALDLAVEWLRMG